MASPFEGRLIRLRAREPGDEPCFYSWMNDTEVTEFLETRYAYSHAFEREWLASLPAPSFANAAFAIETLADGKLIGNCSLGGSSPEHRSATLGIMIGEKKFWNGGYGTDAMRTLCRFGFEMMNLHRIELDVFVPNERARHVYEKIGFRLEAIRRQAQFRQGHYLDVATMGLLEGELKLD
ncbi:MAG: GNAT family N-acetyltransferase [Dehalococcoidia bacterium]|nr:GNAT family N-acetyltransferase [Dehalococcoidia bacterium]